MDFYTKEFIIDNRPLILLCGPAIDKSEVKKDRRIILADYINTYLKKSVDDLYESDKSFHCIPIIVDEILGNQDFINKFSLDPKLFEEILSKTSAKTYIFLDSTSTAYELGLFSSFYLRANVTYFIEKGYKSRASNQIGDYIILSNNNHVLYNGYQKKSNGFLYFAGDQVPSEIKAYVNSDFTPLFKDHDFTFKTSFSESETLDDTTVVYKCSYNEVVFSIPIKTLFIYVKAVAGSEIEKFDNFYEEKAKEVLEKIKKKILVDFCTEINNAFADFYIIKKPNVTVQTDFEKNNLLYLLKHMIAVVVLIMKQQQNNFNKKSAKVLSVVSKVNKLYFSLNDHSFEKAANFTKNDLRMSKLYLKNSWLFVDKRVIRINGKNRNIVSYISNNYGSSLKILHYKISKMLSEGFEPSGGSYAYKKGCNSLKCISRHRQSVYFYKLDIHHFFESIRISKLEKVLNYYLEKSNGTEIDFFSKQTVKQKRGSYTFICSILKLAFYKGTIPLGFITSPILSDIFLRPLDEYIEKTYPFVIYTRYADDILISSSQKEIVDLVKSDLINKLKVFNLKLNDKKTIEKSILKNGDYIKYLGLNLVKKAGRNELVITISKKYLVKVSIMLNRFIKSEKQVDPIKLLGMLNFIESNSLASFKKLISIYEKVTKNSFEKSTEILKEACGYKKGIFF
jgi:RNA-directed DNA polymerase